MLEYEKEIFLDILQGDGLVIAAKGLGLDSVIVNLLKVYCDPGNLVFVIGAEGKLQDWLIKKLKSTGVSPQPKVSVESGTSERTQSYLEGGLWFVPSRVLVVDMLKKRVPIDLITGFIVCKAHNILKNHLDAFVLRLYRQDNKTGFIKAFSDQSTAFMGGFNKVEQILKALFTKNLLLWPRYHATVKSSLNICQPIVIELHIQMTEKMLQLQTALLDLIKLTVEELKKLNPTLSSEEITVENVINPTFFKALHFQTDSVWHALSERTKALLADLKLFHYIILALLSRDSVSFYALINSQRKSDCAIKGSGWHFLPSAEVVFTTAKHRVFTSVDADITDPTQFDAEPNPKWVMLSEVLVEIHKEFWNSNKESPETSSDEDIEKLLEDIFHSGSDSQSENNCSESADILILARDERNCFQLQMFLTAGSDKFLSSQNEKFFLNKKGNKDFRDETEEVQNDEEKNENEKPSEVVLPEEAGSADDLEEDTYFLSLSDMGFSKLENNDKVNVAGYFEDKLSFSQKNALLSDEIIMTPPSPHKATPVIAIKSYNKNLINMPQILEEHKPRWVIIYDPEMTLVRQLEVYQRNNPKIQLKVYFLVFGGTIEEQSYLTSLRKEKEAFDFLIEEKARVVIPSDINDYPGMSRNDNSTQELLSKTRKGGMESPKKGLIIVDIREFRSELPALIHARGIDIEPLMITIGDYILTPDICLERKSVSDLIQSLNSGRLYNQAVEMTRYYSKPMLLIEFDKDKPFDLQDRYYLSTDASSEHLVTKLQLLTLHFPQLRLIWSPSPLATALLFEELKQGHPEPDPATALGLGVEQNATDEDKFNPGVQKFISHLPGVTNKNLYQLLNRGKSIDHIRTLSAEEISNILQNSVEGENLYKAIHNKFHPDQSSSSITSNKGRMGFARNRGKRKRFH